LNGDFYDNYSKSFYSYFDKLTKFSDPDANDQINLSKPVIEIVNKIAGFKRAYLQY